MEKIRTINYSEVCDNFRTVQEALNLSDVTSAPLLLVERCELLLSDFIMTHIDDLEAAEHLTRNRELLSAKLHSIRDGLEEATAMLMECHYFVSEIREKEDEKGGAE